MALVRHAGYNWGKAKQGDINEQDLSPVRPRPDVFNASIDAGMAAWWTSGLFHLGLHCFV